MKKPIDREPKREPVSSKMNMKAKPNWEALDVDTEETPDRYRINPALIPEGMSAQWVTSTVFGQSMDQHRAKFEKKGWTPVHQQDFDGQFNGMFMPRDRDGEITLDGMVLMMRPAEITERARLRERRAAFEQVAIKEQSLRAGDLPVSLDAGHPTAVQSNRITKSYERIEIPKE